MEEHKDFFKWYKTKVTENLQEPPADTWDNIADELDTNDVWNRVAADLDNRSGWWPKKALYPALAVMFLLFVTGGAYYYAVNENEVDITQTSQVDNTIDAEEREVPNRSGNDPAQQSPGAVRESDEKDQRRNTDAQKTESSTKTDRPADEAINARQELASSETDHSGTTAGRIAAKPDSTLAVAQAESTRTAQGNASIEPRANEIATDEADASNEEIANDVATDQPANKTLASGDLPANELAVDGLPANEHSASELVWSMPDSMLTVAVEEIAILPALMDTTTPDDDNANTFRRSVLVGFTASVKNTWLLNRQTFTGLEKKTLHTTRPDFGKDLGIVLGYDFSPHFALQAEGHFISEMGQRYKEYRNGKFVTRDIDLNYYHTNLLLKYSRNKYRHGLSANAHALTGGIFYSVLNTAREDIDGKTAQASDDYHRNDYGAIVGYEYNQFFAERFELTTGLRMNLGFRDIGTDSWIRTTSGTFSVNVAIKYRLFID